MFSFYIDLTKWGATSSSSLRKVSILVYYCETREPSDLANRKKAKEYLSGWKNGF